MSGHQQVNESHWNLCIPGLIRRQPVHYPLRVSQFNPFILLSLLLLLLYYPVVLNVSDVIVLS